MLLDILVHELNTVRGLLGEPTRLEYASLALDCVTVMLRFGLRPLPVTPVVTVMSGRNASAVEAAVTEAGVNHAVGFNYRRLPAVALMQRMIAEGAIGELRLWRATWLSDEFADPATPYDLRFDRAMGGTTRASDTARRSRTRPPTCSGAGRKRRGRRVSARAQRCRRSATRWRPPPPPAAG